MRGHRSHLLRDEEMFDTSLLKDGHVPQSLAVHDNQLVLLWQPPSAATIELIRASYPNAPILAGRFEAETPVEAAGLPYWIAADFMPFRTALSLEYATFDAQRAWSEPRPPEYMGMSLVDGDFARIGRWFELVTCIAALLLIRRAHPDLRVVTDWAGARIAGSVGLQVQRLWQADLADRNWPPRTQLRERLLGQRGLLRRWKQDPAQVLPATTPAADVVFWVGGWVEQRLLDSFPIQPLAERGRKCLLWVSRRSAAVESLVRRTGVSCEVLQEPLPAYDTGSLIRRVAEWCDQAVEGGYFAPLRGPAALRMARFTNWPRWVPKLMAMHHMLTARLNRVRPNLLVAPGEKDWGAYCAHHAARALGIPSVGSRHGAWPAGSSAEMFGLRWMFPAAATHILAFSPADAEICRPVCGNRPEVMVWQGNPRLDKPQTRISESARDNPRILLGLHGAGPGSPLGMRRRARPLSQQLLNALAARFGERIGVRFHPWDRPEHFDSKWRHLFLPQSEDLDTQLLRHAALVTSYSTVAVEAAAAGLPVFVWDYAGLSYDKCEVAMHGALVATGDLGGLGDEIERFLGDREYRNELISRAARFPEYLRSTIPNYRGSMSGAIADWLLSAMR